MKSNLETSPLTFDAVRERCDELENEYASYHRKERILPFDLIDLGALILIILFWLLSESALAAVEEIEDHETHSYSSLWLKSESPDGTSNYAATTLDTKVDILISGPILRAKVSQSFKNNSQSWAEGVYSFPLPENASVDELKMLVGEQIIEGVIQEKETAKRNYEKAKHKGQRTSLLNQHQANIFTTSVANIAPNDTIYIEFEYQQLLDFKTDTYTLRFPMVSTPKYTPPSVEKRNFVKPINALRSESQAPGNPVAINVTLNASVPILEPVSQSHPIEVTKLDETSYSINLKGVAELSNRDFLLDWKLQSSSEPIVSILKEDLDGELYGMLMVVPPMTAHSDNTNLSRELIFVLDVSGSMQGESIRQAKSALRQAIDTLNVNDRFNLIWFNNRSWQLFPSSKLATSEHIGHAFRKIEALTANGGTHMLPALRKALTGKQTSHDTPLRQVIFITDGAISNEEELFDEIKRTLGTNRLFTVGIGSAPNSYFMRKAARAGRGTFTYVSSPSEVEHKMDALFEQISSPSLTNLNLDFQGYEAEVLPNPLPDLYLGEPIYAVFKADHFPEHVFLSGDLDGVSSWLKVSLESRKNHSGIAKEWARRKIQHLLEQHRKASGEKKQSLRKQIITNAIKHHQVSPFTSLIAIDTTPVRAGGELRSERIPANRPKGWQNASSNIKLAQTATSAPMNLMTGIVLIVLSLIAFWWRQRCFVR